MWALAESSSLVNFPGLAFLLGRLRGEELMPLACLKVPASGHGQRGSESEWCSSRQIPRII